MSQTQYNHYVLRDAGSATSFFSAEKNNPLAAALSDDDLRPFLEKEDLAVGANQGADFYASVIKFIIGYIDLEKGLSDLSG